MKWIFLLLLPLNLFAQESYDNCLEILPQHYQVEYDADKSYYWSVPNADIVSYDNNSITIQWPDSVGTYIISVYTTRFTCEGDTSYHQVTIKDCPYLQIYVPNAFTPNDDNHNETFYVHGADDDEIKSMIIFNRWGEKVHETNSNEPWDGEDCQIGIYTYSIKTHNQHYIGRVTLIR